MSESKIIQLPGLPQAEPDPVFVARGELAATLLKLYKLMNSQSLAAHTLDMQDVGLELEHIANLIGEQRDAIVEVLAETLRSGDDDAE